MMNNFHILALTFSEGIPSRYEVARKQGILGHVTVDAGKARGSFDRLDMSGGSLGSASLARSGDQAGLIDSGELQARLSGLKFDQISSSKELPRLVLMTPSSQYEFQRIGRLVYDVIDSNGVLCSMRLCDPARIGDLLLAVPRILVRLCCALFGLRDRTWPGWVFYDCQRSFEEEDLSFIVLASVAARHVAWKTCYAHSDMM